MKHLILALAFLAFGCSKQAEVVVEATVDGVLVDVRDSRSFADGHQEGALNIHLAYGQLEKRAATYLTDKSEWVLLSMPPGHEDEAADAEKLLKGLGYEHVAYTPFVGKTTLRTTTAAELKTRLTEPNPPVVIDVRSQAEWDNGVIEGALTVDASEAPSLLPELNAEQEYAVICAGGVRSSQMASFLQMKGLKATNVIDGMSAWYKLED